MLVEILGVLENTVFENLGIIRKKSIENFGIFCLFCLDFQEIISIFAPYL